MPTAAEIAWLIPVLPLIGACLSGLGLLSFNRTVNRLRKPVALLLISNAVQNAMNGGDNSLTGGILLALVLVVLSYGFEVATYRSSRYPSGSLSRSKDSLSFRIA